MLSFLVLLLVAYIVYLHAKIVRTGLSQAEHPVFVMEKPELPRKLQTVQDQLDRWREEGRVSLEDHERFSYMLREDAEKQQTEKRR